MVRSSSSVAAASFSFSSHFYPLFVVLFVTMTVSLIVIESFCLLLSSMKNNHQQNEVNVDDDDDDVPISSARCRHPDQIRKSLFQTYYNVRTEKERSWEKKRMNDYVCFLLSLSLCLLFFEMISFFTALVMFHSLDFIKVEYSSVILRTSAMARKEERQTGCTRILCQMICSYYSSDFFDERIAASILMTTISLQFSSSSDNEVNITYI